jgi:hypothetical protein
MRSNPRLNVRVRTIDAPHELPRGRVLRIEPGSRVEPIVTLLWGSGQWVEEEEHARAVRLGLNAAVFTGGRVGYEWSERGRPLPARARVGIPDPLRPWVLVAPSVSMSDGTIERITGLSNPQPHFIAPAVVSRKAAPVWWFPSPSVILSLLGRVSCVLAQPGPLAWDAARLGVPVIDPETTQRLPRNIVERRLAGVVPAALALDRAFWHGLATELQGANEEPEWGTVSWLLSVREGRSKRGNTSLFAAASAKRKLLKLRQEPGRFWADSAVARYVGERPRWGSPVSEQERAEAP